MESTVRVQRALSSVAQRQAPSRAVYVCVAQYGNSRQSSQRRGIHTSVSREKPAALSPSSVSSSTSTIAAAPPASEKPTMSGLSVLPFSQVLRTYFITSISSSPRLLSISTSLLQRMLNSRNPFFRIDTNAIIRGLLVQTFYKQFCAGETEAQVTRRCNELRQQGYAGVILEYAPEVTADAEGNEKEDVAFWRKGMLDSISMAKPGDFIGLKWSGMGVGAMNRMKKNEEPNERMLEAMNTLCTTAKEKGVSLLPAAEETDTLKGFLNWCMSMQRAYNTGGKSVVYCTYQAYLKQTPGNVAEHLAYAKKEGFTLGIKMVRGAYLASEDRSKIFDTIEGTHSCYDDIASALIHREYNDTLQPTEEKAGQQMPDINVVLATHNADSVSKAYALRQEQASRGETLTTLNFAQLQGMADEVSCGLIAAAKANAGDPKTVKEQVFKCATWGPIYDCLSFLIRRAAENKDAAGRTSETRDAMRAEIWRRVRRAFGLA